MAYIIYILIRVQTTKKKWNRCKRNIKNIAFRKPTHNVFYIRLHRLIDSYCTRRAWRQSVTWILPDVANEFLWSIKHAQYPNHSRKMNRVKYILEHLKTCSWFSTFMAVSYQIPYIQDNKKEKNTNLLQKISETLDLYPFIF